MGYRATVPWSLVSPIGMLKSLLSDGQLECRRSIDLSWKGWRLLLSIKHYHERLLARLWSIGSWLPHRRGIERPHVLQTCLNLLLLNLFRASGLRSLMDCNRMFFGLRILEFLQYRIDIHSLPGRQCYVLVVGSFLIFDGR